MLTFISAFIEVFLENFVVILILGLIISSIRYLYSKTLRKNDDSTKGVDQNYNNEETPTSTGKFYEQQKIPKNDSKGIFSIEKTYEGTSEELISSNNHIKDSKTSVIQQHDDLEDIRKAIEKRQRRNRIIRIPISETKNILVFTTVVLLSLSVIYFLNSSDLLDKYSFTVSPEERAYRQIEADFIANYDKNIPESWQTVNLSGVGIISIPKTLEIRDKESVISIVNESFSGNILEVLDVTYTPPDSKFVFQQSGLNDLDEDSLDQYSRVIVSTYESSDYDFERWESYDDRQSELQNLKSDVEELLQELGEKSGCTVVSDFNGVVKINGMYALNAEYTRDCDFQTGGPVHVEMYQIYDNGRSVELVLSYRINEKEKWEEDYKRIVDSFIITY